MSSTEPDNTDQSGNLITRTDEGASIEATLKRGEGTRDEDRVKIKGKGKTAEEAIEEFDKLLTEYEERFGQRLRNLNTERENSEDWR